MADGCCRCRQGVSVGRCGRGRVGQRAVRGTVTAHDHGHDDAGQAECRHRPVGHCETGGQSVGLRAAGCGPVGDHAAVDRRSQRRRYGRSHVTGHVGDSGCRPHLGWRDGQGRGRRRRALDKPMPMATATSGRTKAAYRHDVSTNAIATKPPAVMATPGHHLAAAEACARRAPEARLRRAPTATRSSGAYDANANPAEARVAPSTVTPIAAKPAAPGEGTQSDSEQVCDGEAGADSSDDARGVQHGVKKASAGCDRKACHGILGCAQDADSARSITIPAVMTRDGLTSGHAAAAMTAMSVATNPPAACR